MKRKKLISTLLGCAMCGCVTTGLAITASADGGATPETAQVTINLNGGFQITDTTAAAPQYSEANVVYTANKGELVLTHETVRAMFNNQPVFQKAAAEDITNGTIVVESTIDPRGAGLKSTFAVDANGYYNYTNGDGVYSPILFGLFEDKDNDGVLDEGETLYKSGDSISITQDTTLSCYYEASMLFGKIETTSLVEADTTVALKKAWSDPNNAAYSETNPNGFRETYTARDLQPLYFQLGEIESWAFNSGASNVHPTAKHIELPDTVVILLSQALQWDTQLESLDVRDVECINDMGLALSGSQTATLRLTFEKIKGLTPNAFRFRDDASYRYVFDIEPNATLLNVNVNNPTKSTVIWGNSKQSLTNPSAIVYVPYGTTAGFYPSEELYAGSSFSAGDARTNMPMREMYRVSFDLNGGTSDGKTTLENTHMDAGAVSMTRNGAEANLSDGTGTLVKNLAAQDLSLLKAEKPVDPVKDGYTFKGWKDQNGYVWTDVDWAAGGYAYDYQSAGAQLTAVWEHSNPNVGAHIYNEEGVCACGETVALDAATVSLGSDTALRFAVKKSVTNGYVAEKVEATFLDKTYTLMQKQTIINGEEYYMYSFDKINPALFGEKISITYSIQSADEEWISAQPIEYSVTQYCYGTLADTSAEAALKTTVVDLLNFGAEMQTYSNYNTDSLVTKDLTNEQKAYATQTDRVLTNATSVSGEKKLIQWENATLELSSTISIQLMFSALEDIDVNGLTAHVSCGDNTMTVSSFETIDYNGTKYVVEIGGMNVSMLTKNVQVYLTDGTNNSQTITYSVESYAYGAQGNAKLGPVVKAMMRYIDSADNYFDPKEYTRQDGYIFFGSYPQSKVTDDGLATTLTSQSSTWVSYGYYVGGSVAEYMQYTDVEYDGEKYRGVKFTQNRMDTTTYSTTTWQTANGYNVNTTYWFKYEPIKWKVLSEGNGQATIICDMVLDSREFNVSVAAGNTYAESAIRTWLNDTFYTVAFDTAEQAIIADSAVDGQSDKLYLLNSAVAMNTTYFADDAARQKAASDYAACQGVKIDDGYATWMLRDGQGTANVQYVYCNGASYYQPVNYTNMGICPVLTLTLG